MNALIINYTGRIDTMPNPTKTKQKKQWCRHIKWDEERGYDYTLEEVYHDCKKTAEELALLFT